MQGCYRNPLCGQEQRMGATPVVRWLIQARIVWLYFLLYCFQCCLLFFLDACLILLGVLLCWFRSSTVELYSLANHCMFSFLNHWPINIHFSSMEVSFLIDSFYLPFLLWTLSTPDWLLRFSVPRFGLSFRVHSTLYVCTYIQHLSLYRLFS